ncbi:MAG: metallophosphoesterase, partial [Planctomycetia bacterium]|nr:metallophosphoesterase [Planctomycetia bacterium]
MRIGIIADIHEDLPALDAVLDLFARAGVGRVVVLGDLFFNGTHVAETVDRLRAAGAVGVFGNHDLGMCLDPDPEVRASHPARVFEFTRTLSARMEVADCLFCHGLPHWDATDPLASYGDHPADSAASRAAAFAATESRMIFVGHFHRWLGATPEGIISWVGTTPLAFDPCHGYLVLVAALEQGWCATYDPATARLVPFRVATARGNASWPTDPPRMSHPVVGSCACRVGSPTRSSSLPSPACSPSRSPAATTPGTGPACGNTAASSSRA